MTASPPTANAASAQAIGTAHNETYKCKLKQLYFITKYKKIKYTAFHIIIFTRLNTSRGYHLYCTLTGISHFI